MVFISSVYSPFSDGMGLSRHNILSPGLLMKSIGAEFLRSDALPGIYYMHGMQDQIVLFIFRSRLLLYSAGYGVNRVQVVLSGYS